MADEMTEVEAPAEAVGSIKYKLLKRTHPEYDPEYWERCRAFYKGGECLLENDALMKRVFPQHQNELDVIYEKRRKAAHYLNYCGEIIDQFVSKLDQDPLRYAQRQQEALPEFYATFVQDCSPPGGDEKSLNRLMNDVLLTALQCKRAYVLVDLPQNTGMVENLAEQEQSGALDAWCVEVAPETVRDWKLDKSGEFEWVLLCYESRERDDIFSDRDYVTEEYVMYTRSAWFKWVVRYKEGATVKDDHPIPLDNYGPLGKSGVPLVKFELPEGLWAMGKLESPARAHFNKANALDWAENKALMPILYEFLDNDPKYMAFGGEGGDPERATNQRRSSAHVQIRNSGDRVEWQAPVAGPFEQSLKSLKSMRDEMHRVTHQMARAVDNDNGNLRRSEGSKQMDEMANDVVAIALGKRLREAAAKLLKKTSETRNETETEWVISGAEEFCEESISDTIEQESVLDTAVEIPSVTFKSIRKYDLARKLLGDGVDEDTLKKVKDEIEAFYSPEYQEHTQTIAIGEFSSEDDAQVEGQDDAQDEGQDGNKKEESAKSSGKKTSYSSFRPQ